MNSASQWIVLAQILRPQGRKGEVLADLFTDFPERFDTHPSVWLAPEGFAEQSEAEQTDAATHAGSQPAASPLTQSAEVVSHWLPVGRNAGRIVLHFAGIDSIEQAEKLSGKEVLIPLEERLPLDSDAAYISDLIGCTVYDRDRAIGTVATVEFPTTPDGTRRLDDAAPLLSVLSPSGDEILIPFARDFLLSLDPAAKSIRMSLPEGLTEINLQSSNESSSPKKSQRSSAAEK
ncbi:MAG: ribosome maturation factor RimM [Acidobacteriaceae bacterium]|nr:ribosome maturation factor RimM [Acidobacteriaceae bacterium]